LDLKPLSGNLRVLASPLLTNCKVLKIEKFFCDRLVASVKISELIVIIKF
jgi:hypothetical protein